MNAICRITDLTKTYHDKSGEIIAVSQFNLEIKPGELLAIVGPSGCGKSTILSVLAGIEKPTSGIIEFNKEQPIIGYMFQNDILFPWLNVKENANLGLDIMKVKDSSKRKKVIKLLKRYGLGEWLNKYPDALSGGMKQRTALIRTLAINPDLLLLDEPTSSLDYQTRLNVSNDIYKIIKESKKAAILVTHDISEAISMADRVIVLTDRPCTIKNIYNIELKNPSTPINNRYDPHFIKYFDAIWKDLGNDE